MVELVIICAGCSSEYMVDTDAPRWECPHCERVIENVNYPFLSARLMEAKSQPVNETDWNALYNDIRNRAQERLIQIKLQYTAQRCEQPQDADLGQVPDIGRFEHGLWKDATLELIKRSHALIVMLESGLE